MKNTRWHNTGISTFFHLYGDISLHRVVAAPKAVHGIRQIRLDHDLAESRLLDLYAGYAVIIPLDNMSHHIRDEYARLSSYLLFLNYPIDLCLKNPNSSQLLQHFPPSAAAYEVFRNRAEAHIIVYFAGKPGCGLR